MEEKIKIIRLRDGEKNTNFFHKTTIQHRITKNFTHIRNEQGEIKEKHEEIERKILHYFKKAHHEPQIDRSHAIEKS